MLRLNLTGEPRWHDLGHGVRVQCRPLTSALFAAANAEADVVELPPGTPFDVRWRHFVKAVARLCIIDWGGVGDSMGDPLDVTPEAVGALMDLHAISTAFVNAFITPTLLMVEEKKGSAPLPNISSGGALSIAGIARMSVRNVRAN